MRRKTVFILKLFPLATLVLLILPIPGYAYTYQDVQDALNNRQSGCVNWAEEVTTEAGNGYKVWQRCNMDLRLQIRIGLSEMGFHLCSTVDFIAMAQVTIILLRE